MRKIVDPSQDHNIAGGLVSIAFAVVLLCSTAGCQSDRKQGPQKPAGAASRDCAATINTEPWHAFTDIGERLSQGEPVPQEKLETYAQMTSVDAWRRSLAPRVPQVGLVANWFKIAFGSEPARSRLDRTSRTMRDNYVYCYERRAVIESLFVRYDQGSETCDLAKLVSFWIRPENMPTPLVVNFLPAVTEIRFFEGQIYADTGALVAGGLAQTNRSIASLLYRELEALSGPNPMTLQGEQCIAECLRVMLNEGVQGWIQQTTKISFSTDHPTLRKVNVVPEDFYRNTQQTIRYFETVLPQLFADPKAMAEKSQEVVRYLAGSNALSLTGIAMAESIVARLGESRLHEVRNSVPEFLVAYQAAALLNDLPVPEPGTAGILLYESVPPLPPAVYEQLLALLRRHF